MRIAVVGTGYVGLVTGLLFRRPGQCGDLCGCECQEGAGSAQGHCPDL